MYLSFLNKIETKDLPNTASNSLSVYIKSYLHDGRARTINEAIRWHGGVAENTKNRYESLSSSDRAALIKFLESLENRITVADRQPTFSDQLTTDKQLAARKAPLSPYNHLLKTLRTLSSRSSRGRGTVRSLPVAGRHRSATHIVVLLHSGHATPGTPGKRSEQLEFGHSTKR